MNARTLAIVVVLILLVGGGAFAAGRFGRVPSSDLEDARATIDSMSAVFDRQEAEADSALAAAVEQRDSALALADRGDSVIVRWRNRPVPEPADTQAILDAFFPMMAAADTLAAVCDSTIGQCREALATADSAHAAERRLRFTAAENAARAQREWLAAQQRIDNMLRWRPYRDAGFAIGGLAIGLGACYAASQ